MTEYGSDEVDEVSLGKKKMKVSPLDFLRSTLIRHSYFSVNFCCPIYAFSIHCTYYISIGECGWLY